MTSSLESVAALLLVLAVPAYGSVDVVGDRIAIDCLSWADCGWQRTSTSGLGDSRFDFFRPAAFVGLSGRVSPVVGVRVSTDVADLSTQWTREFYVESRWPNGLSLRAGQFVLPLGREALTRLQDLSFIEYSTVSRWWKPGGPCDIGVVADYESYVWGVACAFVNGNGGRSYADNNKWKDACLRVRFSHLAGGRLEAGLRGYAGRAEDIGHSFLSVAGDLQLDLKRLTVVGEGQHATLSTYERNSFRVQAAYRANDLLEPVARFQIEFQKDDRYDFGLTWGLNLRVPGDRVSVMLDFDYWRKESSSPTARVSRQKILLRVQAAL